MKLLIKYFLENDNVSKNKYDNDLVYSSVHNFNKYSVSNFNEISSVDSKFDTLNKFYKDFLKLKKVKSSNKKTNQKKIAVLKMYHCFMMSWLICTQKNIRFLEVKMRTGSKNIITAI